jgi:hypothetical protein
VLQDRLLSSLLVLEEEAGRLGLPLGAGADRPEFPTAKRAVFSVILNRNRSARALPSRPSRWPS